MYFNSSELSWLSWRFLYTHGSWWQFCLTFLQLNHLQIFLQTNCLYLSKFPYDATKIQNSNYSKAQQTIWLQFIGLLFPLAKWKPHLKRMVPVILSTWSQLDSVPMLHLHEEFSLRILSS